MTRVIVAALIATMSVAAGAQEIRSRAANEIPSLLADKKVPSVSIARVAAGHIVFSGAYGMQAPGIPATTKTLYNIASLSKPISAEVVLRLVSQGRLSLDDPMYLYWTDPDIANDDRRKLLTPRLAMSHQTGFPNWRRETGGVLAFKRAPGEGYGYSGEGFEYLARYAEKKTHTDFEALAQSLVLDPSKMADTAYTRRAWFDGRIALPTDSQGKVLQPQIADHWNASDLIYTTPTDYALFMLAVIRGDRLSPAIAAERIRIQVMEGSKSCAIAKIAGCPDAQGFGLGWEIIKFGDKTFLMHTGHDEGVATFALIDLKRRSGTVIFTNSSNGFSVVPGILDLVGTDPKLLECLERDAC